MSYSNVVMPSAFRLFGRYFVRVSTVFFTLGLFEFVWGFWGDFVAPTLNPSPSIASRFEVGLIFWVVSFALYIVRKRKTDRELP
jgi:hypothetical protein